MIWSKPLQFINTFIDELDQQLQSCTSEQQLSKTQKYWLSFCIMGILLANKVCWAEFERISLGGYTLSALSWMFEQSKIPWESLLSCSMKLILRRYGISEGLLIGDDSDRACVGPALSYRLPSFGTFSTSLDPVYSFGIPRQVKMSGIMVDMDAVVNSLWAKNNDATLTKTIGPQIGMMTSALEHRVPELFFTNEQNPGEAVSAVKALAIASAQGQRIY